MNKRAVYNELMARGIDRPALPGYVRVGRSKLTPREHILCLWLKVKFSHGPGAVEAWQELKLAIWGQPITPTLRKFVNADFGHVSPPRTYKPRPGMAQRGPRNPFWRGRHDPSFLEALSRHRMGKGNPMYGSVRPAETRRQISEALRGVPKPASTKAKMAEAHRNLPKYQCHACGKWMQKAMLVRHHANRCKEAR